MAVAALTVSSCNDKHRATVEQCTDRSTGSNSKGFGRDIPRRFSNGGSAFGAWILSRGGSTTSAFGGLRSTAKVSIAFTIGLGFRSEKWNGAVEKRDHISNVRKGVVVKVRVRQAAFNVKFLELLLGNVDQNQSSNVSFVSTSIVGLKRMSRCIIDAETKVQGLGNKVKDLRNRNLVGDNEWIVQWILESQTDKHVIR